MHFGIKALNQKTNQYEDLDHKNTAWTHFLYVHNIQPTYLHSQQQNIIKKQKQLVIYQKNKN